MDLVIATSGAAKEIAATSFLMTGSFLQETADRIRRIIYIGDYFYTLSDEKVMIIDMKTYEKVDEIIFENTYEEKTIEEPVIVY